jgi:hypothetical protein
MYLYSFVPRASGPIVRRALAALKDRLACGVFGFFNKGRKQIIVKAKERIAFLAALILALLLAPNVKAQEQQKALQNPFLQNIIRFERNLPPGDSQFFSGAVRNLLSLAHTLLDKPAAGPDDDGGPPPLKLPGASPTQTVNTTATATQTANTTTTAAQRAALVNLANAFNAKADEGAKTDVQQITSANQAFQLSHIGGFNQSTTSTAWCGPNVVTSYQSSLAALITDVVPFIANPNQFAFSGSSVGVSVSDNNGESFTDQVVLNPGPTVLTDTENDAQAIGGNPVVTCTDTNSFYILTSPFTSVKANLVTFTPQFFASVGLSISGNGGKQWGAPAPVVTKDGFFHLLDGAWLAVDPHDKNRMYVSYVDIDLEGIFTNTIATSRCPNAARRGIEVVNSSDGGRTWSAPTVLLDDCEVFVNMNEVSKVPVATQAAVGADGKVFVAYSLLRIDGADELRLQRSLDHGNTFGPAVLVSNIVPTGVPSGPSASILQAVFSNIPVPAIAADPVKKDTLYLTWSDGRDNPQVDVITPNGLYNFADIVLAKSTDGGGTWSAPKAVSPTPSDFAGAGRDQFQANIGVNQNGTLAICYYDRRNDPLNMGIDRFCSVSKDRGATFQDQRQTTATWPPVHGMDFLLDGGAISGYDTVAPHQGPGKDDLFFGAFAVIDNNVTTVHGRSFQGEN